MFKPKEKTGMLPKISGRLSHGNRRNYSIAAQARTTQKTGGGGYLLALWKNVLMVGQFNGLLREME